MNKGALSYSLPVLLIFASLVFTLFLGGYGQELVGHEFPVILGIFAYTLLLVEILLATRPKIFERKTGLQTLYMVHGTMALTLLGLALIHIILEISRVKLAHIAIPTGPLGMLGFLCLLITTLMGALHLSGTFISHSAKLMSRKDGPGKRERALWLHRLSLVAALVLFGHILSIPEIRQNRLFIGLLAVYLVAILARYVQTKLKDYRTTHSLSHSGSLTEDVYELQFAPVSDKPFEFQAGQYVFVRFTDSALPKESHPFSIVNAPSEKKGILQLLPKKSGDYTSHLQRLKAGDKAAIEGPYGNFWDPKVRTQQNPLVFLAGGIGITPYLSILAELKATGHKRPIYLVWGVSTFKDAFHLAEFQQVAEDDPNFHFYLTLSREENPLCDHGRINTAYLEKIGVADLYAKADFFICGPAAMIESLEAVLKEQQVAPARIHIEKFSF